MKAAVIATAGAIVAAVIAIAAVNSLSGGGSSASQVSMAPLGSSGPRVSISDSKGRPVVVTFFASWCVPCHQELPVIASVQKQQARAVDFVGVDVSDDTASAQSLVRASEVAFPVGTDPDYKVSGDVFHLIGLPATVFLDSTGKTVGAVNGPVTASSLESWVHRLEMT